MLARLWRLILRLLHLARPPGSVTHIEVIDMTVRTITWQLPSVGATQRPIDHVVVEFRIKPSAGSPPWSLQDQVDAKAEQKLVIPDPAPGTFQYRLTAVDLDGRADPNPPVVEAALAFDAPGSVTNVQVVDSAA